MQRLESRTALLLLSIAVTVGAARVASAQDDPNSAPNRARAAGAAASGATDTGAQPAAPPASSDMGGAPASAPGEEGSPSEAPGAGTAADQGTPGSVAVPGAPAAPGNAQTAAATAATLDTYTIQQGDTLWDICTKMLGDPFFWPKLWTFNQYITNPHFIYPGNVLSFHEGTETQPPQFDVNKPQPVEATPVAIAQEPTAVPAVPVTNEDVQEGGGAAAGPEPTPVAVRAQPLIAMASPMVDQGNFAVNLRQEGFIAEQAVPPVGYIYKSDEEKRNLATNDMVYLKFSGGTPEVGKKFTVFRTIRKVRHPKTHGYIGFLIRILAQLEVTSVNGNVATAKVTDAYDAVNRGDPITDYVDVLRSVSPAPNTANLDGVVVETMADGATIMGNGDVLYLDKGKNDGLQIGNTVDVIRHGDGLLRPGDNDSTLPNEVTARLVIVGARDRTATAVVMNAVDAVTIGDKIRIRPN